MPSIAPVDGCLRLFSRWPHRSRIPRRAIRADPGKGSLHVWSSLGVRTALFPGEGDAHRKNGLLVPPGHFDFTLHHFATRGNGSQKNNDLAALADLPFNFFCPAEAGADIDIDEYAVAGGGELRPDFGQWVSLKVQAVGKVFSLTRLSSRFADSTIRFAILL